MLPPFLSTPTTPIHAPIDSQVKERRKTRFLSEI
jgi:hypothetical protein